MSNLLIEALTLRCKQHAIDFTGNQTAAYHRGEEALLKALLLEIAHFADTRGHDGLDVLAEAIEALQLERETPIKKPIRIKCVDMFGNVSYLHNRNSWALVSENGTPLALSNLFTCVTALRFALDDAKTPTDVLNALNEHITLYKSGPKQGKPTVTVSQV